jgi:hypothetical protein
MIRDSEEAVSRQYQSALTAKDPSPPDTFQQGVLPLHPEISLSAQSRSPGLNCQMSNRIDIHNLPGPHQSSHLPEMGQKISSTDLHSSPLGPGFDSGQTELCFCNGPCTCPGTLPGWLSTKTSSSEDISLILHLVQNMSDRIATLEQQYKGHASHPDALPSSPSLNQPPLIQSGLSSSMRQDYMRGNAVEPGNGPHIQNASSAFTRLSNEHFSSADNRNDSLDWVTLLDIDNSEDQSS